MADLERFILDHWADLEPNDVGPFEARSVAVQDDVVIVTCTALAPPNPRHVTLSLADVQVLMDGAPKASSKKSSSKKTASSANADDPTIPDSKVEIDPA